MMKSRATHFQSCMSVVTQSAKQACEEVGGRPYTAVPSSWDSVTTGAILCTSAAAGTGICTCNQIVTPQCLRYKNRS